MSSIKQSIYRVVSGDVPSCLHRYLCSLILLVASLACLPLHAASINGQYRVDIGESERLMLAMLQYQREEISHTMVDHIQMQEMCKNPAIRLVDKNRPAILLYNTSDPNVDGGQNELTQFTIDLQQAGFEFGNGDFDPDVFDLGLTYLSPFSDSGISISSSFGTVSDTDPTLDPTKLVVDIEGLTSGSAVIFRVDLDRSSSSGLQFPDYREVLYGAETLSGVGEAALVTATFEAGSGENAMTATTGFNKLGRNFEGAIMNSGLLEGYHAQSDSVMSMQTGGTSVPEPSAALLLLIGTATGLLNRRRV